VRGEGIEADGGGVDIERGGGGEVRKFNLHNGVQGAAFAVRVTPRARKTGVAGVMEDGTIRVRVASPPVEGKANEALLEFLARVLGVRRSRMEIVAGERGLDKLVSVHDMSAVEAQARIQAWIGREQGDEGSLSG
jgi:hypothetical protein